MDALKRNNSTHFTAFLRKISLRNSHRISDKKSTHRRFWQINVRITRLSWMQWKKYFTAILQKFNVKFTAFLTNFSTHLFFNVYWMGFKFTTKISEAGNRWCSGLRSCRLTGGETWKPMSSSFVFLRIPLNAVKKIFHRYSPQKRCEKYLFIFAPFQRVSYEKSPPNLDPVTIIIINARKGTFSHRVVKFKAVQKIRDNCIMRLKYPKLNSIWHIFVFVSSVQRKSVRFAWRPKTCIGQTDFGSGQGAHCDSTQWSWRKLSRAHRPAIGNFSSVWSDQYLHSDVIGLTNTLISLCLFGQIPNFRFVWFVEGPHSGLFGLAKTQISACLVWV